MLDFMNPFAMLRRRREARQAEADRIAEVARMKQQARLEKLNQGLSATRRLNLVQTPLEATLLEKRQEEMKEMLTAQRAYRKYQESLSARNVSADKALAGNISARNDDALSIQARDIISNISQSSRDIGVSDYGCSNDSHSHSSHTDSGTSSSSDCGNSDSGSSSSDSSSCGSCD